MPTLDPTVPPEPTAEPTVPVPTPQPTAEPDEPVTPSGSLPLNLDAAAAPEAAWAGEAVTITLRLAPSDAAREAVVSDVTVSSVLPEGLLFDALPEDDGEYVDETRRVTWFLGDLSSGEERTLRLRCLIGDEAPDLMVAPLYLVANGVRGRATREVEVRRLFARTESDVTAEEGGELVSADGRVAVRFPSGAVDDRARVEHVAGEVRRLRVGGNGVALQFEINARTVGRREDEPLHRFDQPLELRVDLEGLVDLRHLARHQIPYLAYLDEETGEWVDVDAHRQDNVLVAEVDHFTTFSGGISTAMESGWTLSTHEAVVSTFDGGLNYAHPIEIPAGRGGIQPALQLSYKSRSVDGLSSWVQSDWVGLGWSVDTIEIVRDYFKPDYTSENGGDPDWGNRDVEWANRYVLVINGTRHLLVPATPNVRGRYHTLDDQFFYIERRNNFGPGSTACPLNGTLENDTQEYWIVRTQDGTEYRLGYTEDAEQVFESCRIASTAVYSPTNVPETYVGKRGDTVAYLWRVDRVTDLRGNVCKYYYAEEETSGDNNAYRENASYLRKIGYNGQLNPAADEDLITTKWRSEVFFDRLNRSGSSVADGDWDAASAYLYQNQYLMRVRITNWDADDQEHENVRLYDLAYEALANDDNDTRLLASITQRGRGGIGTLPVTTFDYEEHENKVHCTQNCGDDEWKEESFVYGRLDEIDNGYGGVTTITYDTPDAADPNDTDYDRTFNYRVERKDVVDGMGAGGGSRVDYTYTPDLSERGYIIDNTAGCDYYSGSETTGGTLVGYEVVTETLKSLAGTALGMTRHQFLLNTNGNPHARVGRENETRQLNPATPTETLVMTETDWEQHRTLTTTVASLIHRPGCHLIYAQTLGVKCIEVS